MTEYAVKPIGLVSSPFLFKNGTPRQATVCSQACAVITINKSIFNNPEHSLEGLDHYTHVWIFFIFHKNNNAHSKAKVKPPRLDGKKTGVFSTRSPYRPNNVGLTLAKIEDISGASLTVSGIDIIDGTPVIDLKPYIPEYDCPGTNLKESKNVLHGVRAQDTGGQTGDTERDLLVKPSIYDGAYDDGDKCTTAWVKSESSNEELDLTSSTQTKHTTEVRLEGNSSKNHPQSSRDMGSLVKCSHDVHAADWVKNAPVARMDVRFTRTAERQLRNFIPAYGDCCSRDGGHVTRVVSELCTDDNNVSEVMPGPTSDIAKLDGGVTSVFPKNSLGNASQPRKVTESSAECNNSMADDGKVAQSRDQINLGNSCGVNDKTVCSPQHGPSEGSGGTPVMVQRSPDKSNISDNVTGHGKSSVSDNVTGHGKSSVSDNARGHGKSSVSDDARGHGKSSVSDNVTGHGKSSVSDNVTGHGKSSVSDDVTGHGKSSVSDDATGHGKSSVSDDATGHGKSSVSDDGTGHGKSSVSDNVTGHGKSSVSDDATGHGKSSVSDDGTGHGKSSVSDNVTGHGKSSVSDDGTGHGKSSVSDDATGHGKSSVSDDATGHGKSSVSDDGTGHGKSSVSDDATGHGKSSVSDNVTGHGKSSVSDDATGHGKSSVSDDARGHGKSSVSDDATGHGKSSVRFNSDRFKLRFVRSIEDARQGIVNILKEDPRSTYRRNHCEDSLYYFTFDMMHVTCWFDDKATEVVRVKPVQDVAVLNDKLANTGL